MYDVVQPAQVVRFLSFRTLESGVRTRNNRKTGQVEEEGGEENEPKRRSVWTNSITQVKIGAAEQ